METSAEDKLQSFLISLPTGELYEIFVFRILICMNYFRLIKQAYHITVHNPALWIFGLFVVGGFNLNFLHFQDSVSVTRVADMNVREVMYFIEHNPGTLAIGSSLVLLVTLTGLVVTNWSRIMLVLGVSSLLETQRLELKSCTKKSLGLLVGVIKISLLTSSFMFVVAVALLGPPLLMHSIESQTVLFIAGVLIFLPLAFTISCINIFTVFYSVLFRNPVGKALNLGTDFFIVNWTTILGLTFVLVALYSAGFAAGILLVYLLKFILVSVVQLSPGLTSHGFTLFSWVVKVATGLVLWVLLAGLNVFFNTSLLLLFLQLITPIKKDAEQKANSEILSAPAVSSP